MIKIKFNTTTCWALQRSSESFNGEFILVNYATDEACLTEYNSLSNSCLLPYSVLQHTLLKFETQHIPCCLMHYVIFIRIYDTDHPDQINEPSYYCSMTQGAQQALRRTMEIYSNTTRFALACNTSSKIIEPIQSRCAVVRYTRLSDKDILSRLIHVCREEKVSSTPFPRPPWESIRNRKAQEGCEKNYGSYLQIWYFEYTCIINQN